MTGAKDGEKEVSIPKRRDREGQKVVNTSRETANLKFLSRDRWRGNGKATARDTYPIVNFSIVVKSHGGDKIFIIDSYCYRRDKI